MPETMEEYLELVRVEESQIPYRRSAACNHPYTGCPRCDNIRARFNLAMRGIRPPENELLGRIDNG